MPELPEVETIRRDLAPLITGRSVSAVRVTPDHVPLVQDGTAKDLVEQVRGRRIEALERRGKYLLFRLDGPDSLYLAVHLRMTGALLHRRDTDVPDLYVRAVLALDNDAELRFADLRKLGRFRLVRDADEILRKLGPEPLSPEFTAAWLKESLRRRKAAVKAVIVDQRVVAGLGNIYADEALFAARLNSQRRASTLSNAEVRRLHRGIRSVLREALGNRGSSFRDYVDAAGREGAHQFRVKVFRRTGQPCYVCGAEIVRTKVGGRGTHYCPRCQPLEGA